MKISEVKNNAFYQMPQWLYEPPYNVLSDKAKQIYMFLFDRRTLSIQNKWFDDKGDVFVYFTNEQLMEKLNCSNKPIIQAKKELHDIGLLREVRQGVNKPNRLYILGSVESTRQEVSKVHTGSVESTLQEVSKVHTIKTNNINTNITNINDDDRTEKLENIQSGTIAQTLRSRGFKLDQIQFQQLFDYISLDGMSIELVQLAISKSADNEARNFRYLKSILDNWKKNNVTTIEEAEKADEQYKSSKRSKSYNGSKDFKTGKYALLGTDISVHEIDPELGF